MASSATVSWAAIILWRWFAEKFCTLVLHSGPCAEVHEVMHIFFKNLSCFVPSTPRARIRIAPFLLLTMLAEDGIPFERNRTRRSFQKTLNVISFCKLLSSSARRLMQSDPNDSAQHYPRTRIEPFLFFRTFASDQITH
jgi:lipid II:glycine glycyltransferase (peptidoglycan interpeptide bridge formation enzyme)